MLPTCFPHTTPRSPTYRTSAKPAHFSESDLLYCLCTLQCCFKSTETVQRARPGSPGRPPRLSQLLSSPSKHAGSHPAQIAWDALARSGPDGSCTLACFRTGFVWPKPDTTSQNSIGPGLVLHNIIRDVCGRTEPNLKVAKLVAGRLRPARNRARWFLHTTELASRPDVLDKPWPGHPDRIQVGFVQYDPCLLWKNGTETDAENRIRHIRSGPMFWLHAGRNGHNQSASGSDPACLLGRFVLTPSLLLNQHQVYCLTANVVWH